MFAVFDDAIVVGKGDLPPCEDGILDTLDTTGFAGKLTDAIIFPNEEIQRVTLFPVSFASRSEHRLVIEGCRRRIRLPRNEVKHLRRALRLNFGERFVESQKTGFRGWALIFLMLIISVALFVTTPDPDFSETLPTARYFVFGVLALLGLGVVLDNLAMPFDVAESPEKKGRDLSGKPPFRSPVLGLGLKIASFAVLAVSYFAPSMLLGPLESTGLYTRIEPNQVLYFMAMAALALLYIGHRLMARPPSVIRPGDNRPHILYLRSFLDDNISDLQWDGPLAAALGIKRASLVAAPWRYIFLFHPMRVLRVFLGWSADTSEEQIGLALRKRGPFVAIGRPGERIPTTGADRFYVTNETWKETVRDLAKSAQFVVLQPAETAGVWWEILHAVRNLPPERILLCLVNFHRHQDAYDDFRIRCSRIFPKPLPRLVGCRNEPCFMYFDRDWTPQLQPVSYRSPIVWPMTFSTPDLDYTLSPFFRALDNAETALPAPTRRYTGHAIAALGIYLFAVPAVLLSRHAERTDTPPPRPTPIPLAAKLDPAFNVDGELGLLSGKMVEFVGMTTRYSITLDSNWQIAPSMAPFDVILRIGNVAEIQIIVGPTQADLSSIGRAIKENLIMKHNARIIDFREGSAERDGRKQFWININAEAKNEALPASPCCGG